MCKNRSAAFGLLDLVILLCTLSILMALSVPGLAAFSQAGILRHETGRLESVLKELSVASLQHRDNLTLTLHSDMYIVTAPDEELPVPPASHNLHPSVSIDLGSQAERQLIFYRGGVNSPASIKLISRDSFCTVVLSLRGRVRSEC